MDKKSYRKKIIIVITLVVAILLVMGIISYMKQRTLRKIHKQKVDAMQKLNEESKHTPTLPVEQKQKMIENMIKTVDSQKNTVPAKAPASL